jgi:nucleoside-diphosphate-sugar epimerase
MQRSLSRTPEAFLVTMPHLRNQPSLEWVTLDLTAPSDILRHLIEPCHYLLHAGSSSSIPVPPLELFETIVGGTRHLLEKARVWHDVGVFQKFLFISSGAVYGQLPYHYEEKISEAHPTAPSTTSSHHAYGEGNRAAEMLCTLYRESYQLSTVITRCFAFSGPHLPLEGHYAIGNFLREVLAGKSPQLKSKGTSRQSYLYGADLMVALWTLLLHGKSSYPYHVGSEEGMTLRELAEKVRSIFQLPNPIVLGESQVGNSYVPEIRHLQEDFGFQERISLEEGLQRHLEWIKSHVN